MSGKKTIDVNNKYYIEVTYNNTHRLYQLIDRHTDKMIVESFNRDAFLLKVNKIVKLNNNIELIVASI